MPYNLQLQQYINKGDSHNLYNAIKATVGPNKKSLAIIEDETGNKIKDQNQRLRIWSNYFNKLYNQESQTDENAVRIN